jgi:hypothetical protein
MLAKIKNLIKSYPVNVFQAVKGSHELKGQLIECIFIYNRVLRENASSHSWFNFFSKAILKEEVNQVRKGVNSCSTRHHDYSPWFESRDRKTKSSLSA